MQTRARPELKSLTIRLFAMAYYSVAWVSILALPHLKDRTGQYQVVLTLLWVGFLISVIVMTRNAIAFPLAYSVFGRFRALRGTQHSICSLRGTQHSICA